MERRLHGACELEVMIHARGIPVKGLCEKKVRSAAQAVSNF